MEKGLKNFLIKFKIRCQCLVGLPLIVSNSNKNKNRCFEAFLRFGICWHKYVNLIMKMESYTNIYESAFDPNI